MGSNKNRRREGRERQESPARQQDDEGLIGQTGRDENLTGSTTYRTLPDQEPNLEEEPER